MSALEPLHAITLTRLEVEYAVPPSLCSAGDWPPETPFPSFLRDASRSQHEAGEASGDGAPPAQDESLSFCTPLCILGAVNGYGLDRSCPNVVRHISGRNLGRHHLRSGELAYLVERHLSQQTAGEFLGVEFWRDLEMVGVLFKIEVWSFGYCFIGKTIRPSLTEGILYEGWIYDALDDVQGHAMPACVGTVDLPRDRDLRKHQESTRMLLTSWGGGQVAGALPTLVEVEEYQWRLFDAAKAVGMDIDRFIGSGPRSTDPSRMAKPPSASGSKRRLEEFESESESESEASESEEPQWRRGRASHAKRLRAARRGKARQVSLEL